MNPSQAFANRTARLAAEAATPVFTSETPSKPEPRSHLTMVEVENEVGRYWSGPYSDKQVKGVCNQYEEMGYSISDIDCSSKCWCAK